MQIKDKIIIITGASQGIGKALAISLSQKGAKVILAARNKQKLEELEKEIPNSLSVVCDMTNFQDIKNLIQTTMDKFGRIDILVNNAGQGLRASIENLKMQDYRNIMELNVFSILEAMQQVIPIMKNQKNGMILNISSMVSKMYFPELAGYSSTKYALNALSLTARAELEKDGIVVSVFHPKMTATEFGANALGEKYNSAAGRPGMNAESAEIVAEEIAKQIESGAAEVMRM